MMRVVVVWMSNILLLLLLLIRSTTNAETDTSKKFVSVSLTSNWNNTPLQLEISEFISSEEPALFWNYAEQLKPTTGSERVDYEQAKEVASQLLQATQLELLTFAINLRYFSPRVEMFRHLYTTFVDSLPLEQQDRIRSCPGAWVFLANTVACSKEEVQHALSSSRSVDNTTLFDFDHIYPSSKGNNIPTAILFATLGTQKFLDLHSILQSEAAASRLQYVFRHLVPNTGEDKVGLPGYGVELAIKSLEYKAVDDSKVEGEDNSKLSIEEDEEEIKGFLFGVLKKRKPHLANELANFKSFLLSNNEQFENLKVWNLKDLGYQAAQRIRSAANPLRLMKEISQSFPTHAVSMSRVRVNETFKSELERNRVIEEGRDMVIINGRVIHPESINPFSLYKILQEEVTKLNALYQLHLTKEDAFKVLSFAPEPQQTAVFRVPSSDVVLYMNDLESDSQYAGWPRSVSELFRRVWPGTFRYIAVNFFTVVVVVDPTTANGIDLITKVESLIAQSAPIRFGIVFATSRYSDLVNSATDQIETNTAVKIVRLFCYLKNKYGVLSASLFLRMLRAESLDDDNLRYTFEASLSRLGSDAKGNLFSKIIEDTEYDAFIRKSNKLIRDLGLSTTPVAFVNGWPLENDNAQELVNQIVSTTFYQVPDLQQMIRTGQIHDGINVYDVLMRQPGLLHRYNKLVLPSSNPLKFLSLTALDSQLQIPYFFNPKTQDATKSVTHLVLIDFSSIEGVNLAIEALKHLALEGTQHTRVGFIYKSEAAQQVSHAISAVSSFSTTAKSLDFTLKLLQRCTTSTGNLGLDDIIAVGSQTNVNTETLKEMLSKDDHHISLAHHTAFCKRVLGTDASDVAIVTNGRIIKFSPGTTFVAEDFKFLGAFEYDKRAKRIEDILSGAQVVDVDPELQTSAFMSDLLMKVVSIVGQDEQNNVEKFTLPSHAKISLSLHNSSTPETFLVTAILNPLSPATQRFTPMLEALSTFFNSKIQIIFNPKTEGGLPLKNFYSYALPTEITFDSNDKLVAPSASFHQLPLTRLLTLNLDTPEAWLVSPVVARYDLDNIKLEDLGKESVLYAQFELQHVLVEGNCYDSTFGNMVPPRGLELVLGVPQSNLEVKGKKQDTIVMSNYGYFQLKANPGVWDLQLKPNSRSHSIYHFVGGTSRIIIDSFLGASQQVMVRKYPNKIHEQLLVEDNSVWSSISNLWPQTESERKKAADTIHVFSLASGHLYERFLKIMMLTVVKNTQSPVKFWLLANFLSPKFKDFIPHMAKAYNFEYELVTYKWPAWLHKQTEKQRVIWGYKILFLDVLFPLDLKKVIYVDADQIVRADLKELWNMNLDGAPYAYTPFCSDNHDVDGFRFWNQGFWQNHLRGLPYHISALYVVDLVQFRRQAAGDILRSNYDQLSQDPNSLANLDQDLPNYLQHQVRIFSLPQEWLWCGTWCSQESKPRAKTIDLCNNPLTKTPKLESAVQIIPEWTSLDNEIKALEKSTLGAAPTQQILQDTASEIVM